MRLRPYQEDAIASIRDSFRAGNRSVLYQLPTGGGKTVIFSAISGASRVPVLILVHRQELLLQASASLARAGIAHQVVAPARVARECSATDGAPVVLATVQSAARRPIVPSPGLILMDEAHHAVCGSWAKVAERWPAARIAGFSATPCRLDGAGLGTAFDSLVTGPTVSQLVAMGNLCPLQVFSVSSVDLVGIREGDVQAVGSRVAPIVGDAVQHWDRYGRQRPAIAFCHSVDAARSLAERFRSHGVPSGCIDGQMPHDARQMAVDGLRSGEVQVLTSCEIVSEGFDAPGAEVALLLRPTHSLSMHLQQMGRVMRPSPGKTHGVVIDMVGNVLRHGLPDDPREWSLSGAVRRPTPDDVAPVSVRVCRECFRAFQPSPRCPYCETAAPARPRKVELVDGALREWTREQVAEERERSRLSARDEMRSAARMGLGALQELARRRGYAPGWARQYHAAFSGRGNRR